MSIHYLLNIKWYCEHYANTNDVHKWGRPQINQQEKSRTSRVGASKPSHQKRDFESTILRDQ